MNRLQLEHVIRAASAIAGDPEIIVIGSQAIHAQFAHLPPETYQSIEADVYPRGRPELADLIDNAIGELTMFSTLFGYYAQGVSPNTAILPMGWEDRLIPLHNENTGGATALCLSVYDLLLSKYVANREKDRVFNRAVIGAHIVDETLLLKLADDLPLPIERCEAIRQCIRRDFHEAAIPRSTHSTSAPR